MTGSVLGPLARTLTEEIGGGTDWLVHGDLHHHTVLRSGRDFVAIDPKPYLAERECGVATRLWNPIGSDLSDPARTEGRIRSFVAAGLVEYEIRAWTLLRGSHLRPGPVFVDRLRSLVE